MIKLLLLKETQKKGKNGNPNITIRLWGVFYLDD